MPTPPTLEQKLIIDELSTITDENLLRDIRYNVGQFHRINLLGYHMRLERRKMMFSDLVYGLVAIGIAGLLSFLFIAAPATIPLFTESIPYIGITSLLAIILAAIRRIRVSDWVFIAYLSAFLLSSTAIVPAMFLGQLAPVFAAFVLFSVSLAIYLNFAFCFYLWRINYGQPSGRLANAQ